ncbi:AEX-3 domain-containing protein [Xylogone sp. PMI_703]|nr:AEX-3 domain-containing protein [Xylogone sp. PMI_703]
MDDSTPLADYFWIAGIDSLSYSDEPFGTSHGRDASPSGMPPVSPGKIEATIEENVEAESPTSPVKPGSSRATARHSHHNSWNQFNNRSSYEPRTSISTLDELEGTRSNRSSMTIRGFNAASIEDSLKNISTPTFDNILATPTTPSFENSLNGFDFDKALIKFAQERESFLDDLTFSAGAQMHIAPPMTAQRPERLTVGGMEAFPRKSPLRSVGGSIRRKLSFRDMSSVKRQSTVVHRTSSVRTARRMSNYNSVIPPPEPINSDPHMHPLKKRFEPVLLDRYPPKHATEDLKRRGRFPDYVPMFAFPNDINIVSADERPRSTWHGFAMTSDNNSKIYGITVIVWMPVHADAAAEVERRCEAWRQAHMTNEERELAASLGERLAAERAHLSQLLAHLPTVASGSDAREALEEQISAVEEKIALMTDMLRPVRHAAAAKIDGLTDGETGLWTPRAYGILGRDPSMTSFWKEWLRAVIVPMTDGAILRVPATSPRVGRWQPLERYVVNLCTEALSPISSKTQVELGVRELRLFARKEATNELPESRGTDLYALFRSLSIPNIVTLFEHALAESRIIFLSSHTAMLHLACKALASLLYPFKWASIFIPVLPARLLSALEAPCPYIVGIERRYDNVTLPEDDFVLVDLDQDSVESTAPPPSMPRQQRRKLVSLLQLAAPHHNRYGVPVGPPPYAIETFPYNAFSSENDAIFTQNAPRSTLAKYVTQNSATFGNPDPPSMTRRLVFNAFLQSKNDHTRVERPSTSRSKNPSPPPSLSPVSGGFSLPSTPTTPLSRNENNFAATLRERRSGYFESVESSRRSSSFGGIERQPTLRRPSVPFANNNVANGHTPRLSTSAISVDSRSVYGYAPSTYAASTIAASTIMPTMLVQPVHNTSNTVWVEGHCFVAQHQDSPFLCSICDEKSDYDGLFKCNSCTTISHGRCLGQVSLVCPAAFHPDRIRAAFVRSFATLLYTYRKFLGRPSKEQTKQGQLYGFDMDGFIKSLPGEQHDYMEMLRQTQAFNEFIHERETTAVTNPSIQLFESIILAKRARGKSGFFNSKAARSQDFLEDRSDHLWVSAAVPTPTAPFQGDYKTVVSRIPARLDPTLMKEPRVYNGVPRIDVDKKKKVGRKAVPSMLGIPDGLVIE